jgi:hypothetical protein
MGNSRETKNLAIIYTAGKKNDFKLKMHFRI